MGGVFWPLSWLAAVEAHLRAARWPWTAGMASRPATEVNTGPAPRTFCHATGLEPSDG
jgi:hypothetical protein